jgi:hypothetical protein
MSGPDPRTIPDHDGAGPASGDRVEPSPAKHRALTSDSLLRRAALIAGGEIRFPTDLSADDAADLAREVRRLRRIGLVRYIARAIAQDIQRASGP